MSSLIVKSQDTPLMDLSIECPSQVNESFEFNITIISNNIVVDNVTVIFDGKRGVTNSEGIAKFFAPRVLPDGDNLYNITAFKKGYNTTKYQIKVLNIPQLHIDIKSYNIAENTFFQLTVVDDVGKIVDNANITFNNKEYISNANGTSTLFTPSVNKTYLSVITVEKPGYINNSILITVYPDISYENIIGFYMVITICIVILISIFLIMYLKYLKKKRINR